MAIREGLYHVAWLTKMVPFCEASVAPIVKVGAFFLFKEEVFYGDTWFVSRKIKGNAFNTPNVGFEWVDEEIFGGEHPERN